MSTANSFDSWLRSFVTAHGGVAGTVHVLRDEQLALCAWHNIPPPVVERTRSIPKGKGMAGLAWERVAPVQTCNLQTDTTGDVRPGAKAVAAQAAIALPVLDEQGRMRAVVGIAFAHERELGAAEIEALSAATKDLPSS